MNPARFAFAIAIASLPSVMWGQFDFNVAGRKVQVHSFATTGYANSDRNNYLTMQTAKGSFAFTDAGANMSTQLTDNFRVGAQVYLRNVGEMGNFTPTLDWALGDYRFKSWLGVRAGRVKTTLGLYNDVQDMDSLHTFAMLPESIYPLDWRSSMIAHDGGDVYGNLEVKKLGSFAYVGYIGMRPQDPTQGYIYASKSTIDFDYLGGRQYGGDLRWTTPLGAVFGVSFRDQDVNADGTMVANGNRYTQNTIVDRLVQYYGQYDLKDFHVDVEYRRNLRDSNLYMFSPTIPFRSNVDTRAWYVAGTYRINDHLQLGAFHSVYEVDKRKSTAAPSAHQYDTALAARVNFNRNWYAKVEHHFIDGAPTTPAAARGFYSIDNPGGVKPTTNMFVVRTGVSF